MRRAGSAVIFSLASLVLVAGVVAGPAAAGERLTKKEFRQAANEFCEVGSIALGEAFNTAFEGLPEGVAFPPEVVEAAADAALPIFREMLDAVEGLEGPPAFEKKVDKLLDQYRAVADDIEDDPALVFDESIWEKPDKVAKRLSVRDCVQADTE